VKLDSSKRLISKRCFNCFKRHDNEWDSGSLEASNECYAEVVGYSSSDILLPGGRENRARVQKSDFEFVCYIGAGSFGRVLLVQKKDTGKKYAMKVLPKATLGHKKQMDHMLTERSILMRNDHPFLVRLRYAFQTKTKLYVLTDFYTGGELWYHLRLHGKFSEDIARFYIGEILLALEYLHSQCIIYRDMKLENALLDEDGHVRLTDFGLSKRCRTPLCSTNTFCGTLEYIAPEVIQHKRYTKAVDWWSLGAALYEMLEGRPPFVHENRRVMFDRILNGRYTFHCEHSKSASSLISVLMTVDPTGRPSDAEMIKRHKFFSNVWAPADWAIGLGKGWTPPFLPLPSGAESSTELAHINPSFTSVPVDDEVAESLVPSAPFADFQNFTYNGDTLIDRGAASRHGGGDPYV
jgi:serum/glucocorticoid-regulated kinase 2